MTARVTYLFLTLGIGVFTCAFLWSLTIGSTEISFGRVFETLTAGASDRESIVLQEVRLPRVLAASLAGSALAIAGAIAQTVTRNPLADPGLLGVNSGAAFAVVFAMSWFGVSRVTSLVWIAYLGAFAALAFVLLFGLMGRRSSLVRLILAGVVIASFLSALTAMILVLDLQTFDAVRQWTVGSVKGRTLEDVVRLAPYILIPLIATFFLPRALDVMNLGSEIATGLGQSQRTWRVITTLGVTVLAGGATALGGPLSFVGLVVPHMVRMLHGPGHGALLPLCAIVGATLTLLADTLPRAVWQTDVPVGISLALLGSPFFIWLALLKSPAAESAT
ncbi:MAG: iron ABC transporter permease [Marinovum sp.]|nr:iron ABC transporter permease [Marinovum sp.]